MPQPCYSTKVKSKQLKKYFLCSHLSSSSSFFLSILFVVSLFSLYFSVHLEKQLMALLSVITGKAPFKCSDTTFYIHDCRSSFFTFAISLSTFLNSSRSSHTHNCTHISPVLNLIIITVQFSLAFHSPLFSSIHYSLPSKTNEKSTNQRTQNENSKPTTSRSQ